MGIDTGARSGGRAASRIGPTHVNVRAPVSRSASRYRRSATSDSSSRVNLSPTLTTAQRIASVPAKRKASLQAALHRVLRSYGSRSISGFTPEQNATLRTVLGVGTSMGATPKEKLSAVETGLVETHFTNPNEDNSDGTSAGWRQETQQARYGSEARRMNPKPTAKDYFSETRSAGRGAGMTAGQLSQRVQGSAYPARYDAVQGKAKQVLKAASAPPPNPRDVHKLAKAGIPTPGHGTAQKAPARKAPVAKGVSAGRFTHPFPGKYWNESRTDQGKDFVPKTGNAPILAPGDATFVGVGQGPSWESGGGGGSGDGIVLKLHDSKGLPAKYVWIYEGVQRDQNLRPGTHVKKGQVVGRAAGAGSSIEMGWANSPEGHVMTPYNGAADGTAMPAGIQMAKFLDGIKQGGNIKIPSLKGISFTGGSGAASGVSFTSASGVSSFTSATGMTAKQAQHMSPRQRMMALRAALNKTLRGYGGIDSASHSSSSSPLTHVSGKPVI